MGHEFFTNEELKSWQSWMDSPESPPLSPSGVKKFTPDYENLDRDKAIEDFRERIKHYEDSYEPLSIEKEGLVGFTVISPSNHFATKKSPRHQRVVCLHSIIYLGFYFFVKPVRIWSRAKYKSVDPLLMILVSNFIPNAEIRFG